MRQIVLLLNYKSLYCVNSEISAKLAELLKADDIKVKLHETCIFEKKIVENVRKSKMY